MSASSLAVFDSLVRAEEALLASLKTIASEHRGMLDALPDGTETRSI